MPKIQNPTRLSSSQAKRVLVIEYWNLRFICNLVLGIWDFNIWYLKHWMLFPYATYLFKT